MVRPISFSIASTASYLHFIPTVAALASERFAHRFAHVLSAAGSRASGGLP